jgi:hypothetical protein
MRIGVGLQPTGLTRGEAPGGGPILSVGIKCHVRIRLPATSDRQFGSRAEKPARAPNGAEWYPRSGKPFQDAGRKTTPSNGSPVVTKRQSAMTSLRASAVLAKAGDHCLARANTAISGASAIPQCERALLLKHQKAPGELDHAAADPGVAGPLFSPGAGLASPCSRRCAPLSSGEPVKPAPGSGPWPARGRAPRATALRSRIGRDRT